MRWLDQLFAKKKPEPDLLTIRRSFEDAAADEEHFPSTIDPRILHVQLIVRHLGDVGQQSVLDIGSGKGRFARVVKDNNPSAHVIAFDLALSMLRSVSDDIATCAGSMTALPFRSASMWGAYATESLEHAVDIEGAVAEMCRVVRDGGRIAIIDKNQEHWGRFKTPEWERWFKREELEKLLRRHCRKVESQFISYWEDVEPDGLFIAWLAEK
ncbi:MAG TPA: class I SAM-dependent methyltransferase [Bryobacteraceae bacterium]|nr:class I SAM-dependent methyltransferase [Bryobacteraceae bacterium]